MCTAVPATGHGQAARGREAGENRLEGAERLASMVLRHGAIGLRSAADTMDAMRSAADA
jgi:hypothetical protein